MADQPNHQDPFKPADPTIPGVTGNPARLRAAPLPPAPLSQGYGQLPAKNILADSRLWIAAGALVLVILISFFFWHSHSAAAKEPNPLAEPAPVAPLASSAPVAGTDAAKAVPFGPGPVATVAELSRPWSSKSFVFRAPQTAQDIPALVVHLPGNVYWGISMREPFGTCEMQYVTDLSRIANEYHYAATHPMVVDPCNQAVYDLDKYGAGPNGVVRGAIVHGAGVRPPLAIEMSARGKQVVAIQIEP